jgi:hypothetical protein
MTAINSSRAEHKPIWRGLLKAAKPHLGGRRAWIAIATIVIGGGFVLNWNWLVAAGWHCFHAQPCAPSPSARTEAGAATASKRRLVLPPQGKANPPRSTNRYFNPTCAIEETEMRKTTNIMLLAVSLGLASVSALYAESAQTPSDISTNLTGSRSHSGMMGGGDMAA